MHLNKRILLLRRVAQNFHTSFTKMKRWITRICRPALRHRLTLKVKKQRFFDPLGTNPKHESSATQL